MTCHQRFHPHHLHANDLSNVILPSGHISRGKSEVVIVNGSRGKKQCHLPGIDDHSIRLRTFSGVGPLSVRAITCKGCFFARTKPFYLPTLQMEWVIDLVFWSENSLFELFQASGEG
ncbi:hypothetical protein TNCT_700991 [Trichonephila clavata]|uniref:Uncharacterized protein n=1 Tax=Trichonephila clavata TaxID=2740835 RepID=A0A8X6G9D9_TRICU|nr:hypothetical protein TNCT_700991 [Trichonephila clavata]